MNIQNLISQLIQSNNPIQSMINLMTPQQKSIANNIQNMSKEEQAQRLANYCNKNGITKQQLSGLIQQLKK